MKINPVILSLTLLALSFSASAQKVILNQKNIVRLNKASSSAHTITTFNNNQFVLGWKADTLHYWALKGQFFNLQGEAQNEKFKFIETDAKRNTEILFSSNDNLIIAAGAGYWAGSGGRANYFMYTYNVKTNVCDTLFDFNRDRLTPQLKGLRVFDKYAYMAFATGEESNSVFKQDITSFDSPLDTLKQFKYFAANMASNNSVCMHKNGVISIAYSLNMFNRYNLTTYNFDGDSLKTYPFFNKEEERNTQVVTSLKSDSEGNYYLLWKDGYSQGNVNGDSIKIQKYSFNGEAEGKEVIVNLNTSTSVQNTNLLCDKTGRLAIVWEDIEQAADDNCKIYLQFLDKDLKMHGNTILLAEGLSSENRFPQTVFLGDTIAVVWYQDETYKMSTVLWEKELEEPVGNLVVKFQKNNTLSVYPNPFTNRFYIRLTLAEAQAIRININTIDGKIVSQVFNGNLSTGSHVIKWESTCNLASGVYFYTLQTKNNIHSGKLIKSY